MKQNMMHVWVVISMVFVTGSSFAQLDSLAATTDENLADAIQNPIAAMISLPFQNNTDFGFEPGNVAKNTLNVQPVVPLSVGAKTNMIVRTIIPIVNQPLEPIGGEAGKSQFGLGDVALSLFFTPKEPGKLVWGVGPAIILPTATDEVLGTEKWSAGPSIIGLVQPNGWTLGGVLQNTWSFAGNKDRQDLNLWYSQIFVVKNLVKGWYVNSAPIITANWNAPKGNQWTVPIGAGVGKLFKIAKRPINAQVGYYNYVVAPDGGPDWQLRLQFNLLYPK